MGCFEELIILIDSWSEHAGTGYCRDGVVSLGKKNMNDGDSNGTFSESNERLLGFWQVQEDGQCTSG